MRGSVRITVIVAAVVALLISGLAASGLGARAATVATSAAPAAAPPGHQAPKPGPLPGTGTQATAVAAATRAAKSTGKPVAVGALTTATTLTTADPNGMLTVTENTVPVRVQRGATWVPVSTTLARGAGGRYAPAAVPGDTVSFSGGGTGPLVTIAAEGTSLTLSWPDGALPAPVVSGASATYPNVLPGVDLVLTATSDESGGFSGVLVIHSVAAARNPALASLRLRAASDGVRLANSSAGLVASGKAGYYQGGEPMVWDSSTFGGGKPLPSRSAMAALGKSARAARASLAPPGTGPATSSAAGPASGARLATTTASVSGDGTSVGMTLDTALLDSGTTHFPVYAAVVPPPAFSWHTLDGDQQHRDEVQSACPTASHYDASDGASDTYWSLGVGYDDWGDGDCSGVDGTAYSYYQVAVPKQIWGGYLNSATVNAQDAYNASCSTTAGVTLSQTGGIGSHTAWDNKPGQVSTSGSYNVTESVPPNSESCNGTYDTSSSAWTGVGFPVLDEMRQAASDHWSNFTFRLWEEGSPSDLDWLRFGPAPYVQIQYDQVPDTPTSLHISSGTTLDDDCLTTPYPWVGKLTSGGVEMKAGLYDKDGDQLEGAFTYWENGDSAQPTVDSSAVGSNDTANAEIPYTFTNGLPDGTEVDWDVYAFNGATAGPTESSPSKECHFYVFPDAAAAPTISGGPGTAEPTPGTSETFDLSAATESGATPTAFVWGLDKAPADSSPASSQVVPLTSGATTAPVTITVPSGGPHAFYAYTEYNTGPVSQLGTSEWDASNDPVVSCASFADALSDTGCTETNSSGDQVAAPSAAANQMISNGDPGCASGTTDTSGTGNGDGSRNTLSSCALQAAGWQPGRTVTVDGATFTLPQFGQSSSGPDNLLAANQTIGMPPGSQGTSLVILATGTNANVPAGGDTLSNTSVAVPTVPTIGSGNVVGPCDSYAAGVQETAGNSAACEEPAGVITYQSGSGVPEQDYSLAVPDWISGPAGAAAVTLSNRATTTGTQADGPKIYAFSIPISPTAPVASVTLPDLGAMVAAATGIAWPAVHVFGIAVANTTTATPGSTATGAAGPWTGGWSSPTEGAFAPPSAVGSDYKSQTIRLVAQVTAGGSTLRLRLSDALAAAGVPALSIGAVTVAPTSSGAAVSAAPTSVTFGGSSSVTIPAGADVYSDPVGLAVTALEHVTVSIDLSGTYASLPEETYCSACTEYVSAVSAGNDTANTSGSPFSGTGTATGDFSTILTGIDVDTGNDLPTAVVLGNGVIDGNTTGKPVQGADRVSDDLAADLALQTGPATFGVVSAGIEANQVLTDSTTADGGPSALSRLARDVLAEPNVGTVVINEGEEDLLNGATEEELENGLGLLSGELEAWGITVIYTTMTPCDGYSTCTSAVDDTRTTLNTELLGQGASPQQGCAAPPGFSCTGLASVYTVDFSTATGNTSSPEQLQSAYNAGDDVNLTDAGYTAEANTIPVIVGEPVPLQAAAPPPDV